MQSPHTHTHRIGKHTKTERHNIKIVYSIFFSTKYDFCIQIGPPPPSLTGFGSPLPPSSWIRQRLDYRFIIYGASRKSYLKILEPLQNAALLLYLCAFQTSPIPSFQVEAGELHMDIRMKKLIKTLLLL